MPGFDAGSDLFVPDVLTDAAADVGQDTTFPDTAEDAIEDATPTDTTGDADVGPTTVKDDPTYLVPADVVARSHLAIGEDGQIAWVERPDGGAPVLVTWNLEEALQPGGGLPPPHQTYFLPIANDPRELVVGGGWIVYSDDPYGDPDVFALNLQTGGQKAVVTKPGAQRHPALFAGRAVWEDCRDCIPGDPAGEAPELYGRELGDAGALEERLTDDTLPDRAPVGGRLADGTPALAWAHDVTGLRVLASDGTEALFDTGELVDSVALSDGVLAFRPSPAIINPDSMMPVDVEIIEIASGDRRGLSTHSQLLLGLPSSPEGGGGVIAWLESIPEAAEPGLRRARAVLVDNPDALVADQVEQGISVVAAGAGLVGFIAPRTDNGDLPDVWLLPVDPL